MIRPTPPTRAALRQLLSALLPTAADFEAFCGDHFPDVAARFASGQNRTERTNLLLELTEPEALQRALQKSSPQRYRRQQQRLQPHGRSRNPYRGLAAFQVEEAALFFGRDALIDALLRRFQALREQKDATRLLTIVGPSGSGKSSVARAGLLAELQAAQAPGAQPLRLIVLKPGEHPLRALALALHPATNPAAPPELSAQRKLIAELRQPSANGELDGLTLWAANLANADPAPVVVLVDQLEEIYTVCSDKKERDAFVGVLLHAASDRSGQVAIVLTLRSDFLGETQRHHRTLNQLIAAQAVLVPALSDSELRQVIAEPAQAAGQALDAATVELLLAEARGSEGALPLLEFALTRIWEELAAGKEPSATLREIGGVGGALAARAQTLYAALGPDEQLTARRALVRLVQLGQGSRDTRRRLPVRELCGSRETEAQVLAVLRKFATENARLVTLSAEGPAAVAEVTHEALFEHWAELRSWIESSRADRRLHDRAAEAARLWDEDKRRPGRLWRRPDLDLLRDYGERKPDELSPLLTAFLQVSRAQQRREKLLSRLSVGAVFMALIGAAGIYFLKENQRLQAERRHNQETSWTNEQFRQRMLDNFVEQGRLLLLEKENPGEALLWLHRAQVNHSDSAILPELLRSARYGVEATQAVLVGHTFVVGSAAYSPDGERIVTASGDSTARIWDARSGRPLVELKGHTGKLVQAAYRWDAKHILTASSDGTARIWDAETGAQLLELQDSHDATYSPDGRRIVTMDRDSAARIWDEQSGRQLALLQGHVGRVLSATYSPDGRRLVTTSWEGTARVWDAETGRPLALLKGHEATVVGAAYGPDAKRIVTASIDATARVWDAETGRGLAVLRGHADRVVSASYSPDGNRILTASYDRTARLWDAKSGRSLAMLQGHGQRIVSATHSPDGKRIATASSDQTIRIWDAETGMQLAVLQGHGDSVTGVAYSPDGKHLLTSSEDRTARIWDAEPRRQLAQVQGHQDGVMSAAYSPDGHRVLSINENHVLHEWEPATGRRQAELKGHTDSIGSATYSPDGKRILTNSRDGTVRVWDAATGRQRSELKGHAAQVLSATYGPDSTRIVTSSQDKTARVWDAETGRELAVLQGHDASVLSAALSPDGRRIVTASNDATARIWDAQSGRQLLVLPGNGTVVTDATFSPSGLRILTTSASARIWDAQSGVELAELKGYGVRIASASFSPDGLRILTIGEDRVRVWDAETGSELIELQGHRDRVLSATYSPDSRRILTASADQTVRVWEAGRGRQLAELRIPGLSFWNATYSPDGQRVLTVSSDLTARIWDVAPETRSERQLAKLISCKVSARFAPGSSLIVPALPNPSDCN